jgi:hypothetical protein
MKAEGTVGAPTCYSCVGAYDVSVAPAANPYEDTMCVLTKVFPLGDFPLGVKKTTTT